MLTILLILAALNVLAFMVRTAVRTESSGAAGAVTPSDVDQGAAVAPRVSAPEKCPDAKRAVRYYRAQAAEWRHKMGAGSHQGPLTSGKPVASCPRIRYLAQRWKRKAYLARKAYLRWHYHYAWWDWMPDKWQRVGACETGYGKRPGRFDWNSGTYQGFAGFYFGTWDAYKPRGAPSEAYLATPRQQYQCALNVYAAHGYGAWGCGGA